MKKNIIKNKRKHDGEIQATDIYLATECIMAQLVTLTWWEKALLLYVWDFILIFHGCVLPIMHTDSYSYSDFLEQLKSDHGINMN